MTDEKSNLVLLALKKAFNLGQRYWQQVDSEYTSQHKKADITLAQFDALCSETADADRALREQAQPAPEDKP